jgi:DnaJ-class molecular chaperone
MANDLMGYCRECRGKGRYKLPGIEKYVLCKECGGSGQAKIDLEKEKLDLIMPRCKGKKDKKDKIGNIWVK